MADIIEIIKKAAMDVVENSSPCSTLFGTVININPLEIQIEQKLILTKEFLVLTKNVVDYEVEVSMAWDTEYKTIDTEHSHKVSGDVQVTSAIQPNENNQKINNNVLVQLQAESASKNITHNHSITGRKTMTIHNALKKNDKVILIQQQGGQKFIVLDKIY